MATYRVTLKTPGGKEHTISVGSDEHILEAALRAGLDLPYSCLRGWCLTCAARVVRGTVNQEDSFRYFQADRDAGFALICTGKPESELVLKTHARNAMREARNRQGLPYPRGNWGERAPRP